jgi:hypothetical protein
MQKDVDIRSAVVKHLDATSDDAGDSMEKTAVNLVEPEREVSTAIASTPGQAQPSLLSRLGDRVTQVHNEDEATESNKEGEVVRAEEHDTYSPTPWFRPNTTPNTNLETQ